MPPRELDELEQIRAMLPLLPADAAFSHLTAARVHGLPLPAFAPTSHSIHVVTSTETAQRRRPGWVGHRGAENRRIVELDGVPVTDLADTWVDLGTYAAGRRRWLQLADVVAAGDAAVLRLLQRQHPTLKTMRALRRVADPAAVLAEIESTLLEKIRPRGKTVLAQALPLLRPWVRSPQESRMRVVFVGVGLPEPVVNLEVVDPRDGRILEVDAGWEQEMVCAEYQGVHHAERTQRSKDSDKCQRLRDLGWTVFELWHEDLEESRRRGALIRRLARDLGVDPRDLDWPDWL